MPVICCKLQSSCFFITYGNRAQDRLRGKIVTGIPLTAALPQSQTLTIEASILPSSHRQTFWLYMCVLFIFHELYLKAIAKWKQWAKESYLFNLLILCASMILQQCFPFRTAKLLFNNLMPHDCIFFMFRMFKFYMEIFLKNREKLPSK